MPSSGREGGIGRAGLAGQRGMRGELDWTAPTTPGEAVTAAAAPEDAVLGLVDEHGD